MLQRRDSFEGNIASGLRISITEILCLFQSMIYLQHHGQHNSSGAWKYKIRVSRIVGLCWRLYFCLVDSNIFTVFLHGFFSLFIYTGKVWDMRPEAKAEGKAVIIVEPALPDWEKFQCLSIRDWLKNYATTTRKLWCCKKELWLSINTTMTLLQDILLSENN